MDRKIFRLVAVMGFLATTFLLASNGWAAEVIKVSKKKRAVYIDEGSSSGFTKGARVCVYNGSKKIGCGKVVKAKTDKAIVRFRSAKSVRKMKKGFSAELLDGGGKGGSGKGAYSFAFGFKYLPGLTPASYSNLSFFFYDPANPDSLWQQIEDRNTDFARFGAEVSFAIGGFNLAIGGRYGTYTKPDFKNVFISDADYVAPPNNPNLFVRTEQSASSIGAWLDFYFLKIPFSNTTWFELGSGLDFDISTVNFAAVRMDDGTAGGAALADFPITQATSSLTVISLRILPNINFYWDPIGVSLATNLIVPITATGASTSVTFFDREDPDGVTNNFEGLTEEDAIADLTEALSHKKAGFAAEIVLGAYFGF